MAPSPRLGAESRVAIIGAGLAGSWLAFELSQRGLTPLLIDSGEGPGTRASGNPAGVVKPFVTRDRGRAETFHVTAFKHLLERLHTHDLADAARFHATDVVQLLDKPWPERPDLERLNSADVCRLTGIPATSVGASSGLLFDGAGWLDPGALCRALVACASVETHFGESARAERAGSTWHIHVGEETAVEVDHVVIASGPALVESPFTAHLPMTPARGQLDRFDRGDATVPARVVTGLHWSISDGDTVVAGSTYQRDDLDAMTREADSALNREGLEHMIGQVVGEGRGSRAEIRATTPDRLPFVGPLCDMARAREDWAELHRGRAPETYAEPTYVPGISVLGGFGSRGIVTAPYSAWLLGTWLCGDANELQKWSAEVSPHRFVVREGRKGRLA